MKKSIAFIFLTALLFVQCEFYQNLPKADYTESIGSGDYPPNAEPGKCYAKCMIPDKYEVQENELAVYTGEKEEENIVIETKEIVIEPATTKWIRQKADRKCLSDDPNDCLVWALVEVPAVIEVREIVIDTTQTDNYEIQKIESRRLVEQGGFTAWQTVLCPSDITPYIVNQVQNVLRHHGYYKGDSSRTLDSATKTGLVAFQKDNGLPIGNLDMRTLKVLNINY